MKPSYRFEGGLIPENTLKTKITIGWIKTNMLDRDMWSELHTNNSVEKLKRMVNRWLWDKWGANIASQIMAKNKDVFTENMVTSLCKVYKDY